MCREGDGVTPGPHWCETAHKIADLSFFPDYFPVPAVLDQLAYLLPDYNHT